MNKLTAIIILSCCFFLASSVSAQSSNEKKFYEKLYLDINNTKQFVLICAQDSTKPVLLHLHGGPGASETSMLRKHNSELENDFTVVYWDQRMAGNSYDKNLPDEEITVKNFVKDVDVLVNYLKSRFKVDKILLIGHSWGSRLGMYAIQEHPENFLAYVGVAQEVASYQGELASFHYADSTANARSDKKTMKALDKIGVPKSGNYLEMYNGGYKGFSKQKQLLLKLDGNSYKKDIYLKWLFSMWFSKEYSFADAARFVKIYDRASMAIMKDPQYDNIDFFKEFPKVDIPVFFISGKYDYVLPWVTVKEYSSALHAPHKEFILFEKSGHNPAFEEPELFNKEILRLYKSILTK